MALGPWVSKIRVQMSASALLGGNHRLKDLAAAASETGGAAFAMYPTSMEELMSIADEGKLMPPKSTWFEPKLRSGLFIHKLQSKFIKIS